MVDNLFVADIVIIVLGHDVLLLHRLGVPGAVSPFSALSVHLLLTIS